MVQRTNGIFSPQKAMHRALMRAANFHKDLNARGEARMLDAMPLQDPRTFRPIVREILDPPTLKPSTTSTKSK